MRVICRAVLIHLLVAGAVAAQQPGRDANGEPLPPGALCRIGPLGRSHLGMVSNLAFSADGSLLASAGNSESAISVWRMDTGQRLRRLAGHTARLVALERLDDGRLVSIDRRGGCRWWDLASGRCTRVARLEGLWEPFAFWVVVSRDGRWCAEIERDRIRRWNLRTGQPLDPLPERLTRGARWVALSPRGRTLAVYYKERVVRLLRMPDGKVLGSLSDIAKTTWARRRLIFIADGARLVVVDGTSRLRILSVPELKPLRTVTLPAPVYCVRPRGPEGIVAACGDGSLWGWPAGGTPAQIKGKGPVPVWWMCVSPDGRYLAGMRGDPWLHCWDLRRGTKLFATSTPESEPTALALTPDGSQVLIGRLDGTIEAHDTRDGGLRWRMEGDGSPVAALRVASSGRRLVAAERSGWFRLWELPSRKLLRRWRGASRGSIIDLDLADDGTRLASVTDGDGTAKLWALPEARLLRTVETGESCNRAAVALVGGGLRCARTNGDQVLCWTLRRGVRLGRDPLAQAGVEVRYSPDGALVATWRGGPVRVWDAQDGRLLHRIERRAVSDLVFSPDGRLLALATRGRIELIEPVTRRVLHTFRTDGGHSSDLAFSADGRRLAALTARGTVLVWSAPRLSLPPRAPWPDLRELPAGAVRRLGQPGMRKWGEEWRVVFSPDSHSFLVRRERLLELWDVARRRPVLRLGDVDAAAFSPDGLQLAVASRDHVIRLWDVRKRQVLCRMEGHTDRLRALAFSEDGKLLASGGEDRTARVWELPGGKLLRTVGKHSSGVLALAVAQGGATLATISWGGTALVWRLSDGRLQQTMAGFGSPRETSRLRYAPGGRHLVCQSESGSSIWESASGKLVLESPDGMGLAFSADGQQVALAGEDSVGLYSLPMGRWIRRSGPGAPGWRVPGPGALRRTAPRKILALFTDETGLVDVWDIRSGKRVSRSRLAPPGGPWLPQALSPCGGLVAGFAAEAVAVWRRNGQRLLPHDVHRGPVSSIVFSPDGKQLVAGQGRQPVIWNLSTGSRRLLPGQQSDTSAIALADSGRLLVIGGLRGVRTLRLTRQPPPADPEIDRLVDSLGRPAYSIRRKAEQSLDAMGLTRLQALFRHRDHPDLHVRTTVRQRIETMLGGLTHRDAIQAIAVGPAGRLVASGCPRCRVLLWDGVKSRPLCGSRRAVRDLAFSPDGRLLAVAGESFLELWDLPGARRLRRLLRAKMITVRFSPDGKLLAAGGERGGVGIWEVESGRLLRRLTADDLHGSVHALAFGPHGRRLASMGDKLRLWDPASGKLLRSFHTEGSSALAFSPDGRQLASDTEDGTILLWDVDPG